MATSRVSPYGVGNLYPNNNGGCPRDMIPFSLKWVGGITVNAVQAAAVNQNLHQEAAIFIQKLAAIHIYSLCSLLVMWLFTYYSLGAGINFGHAVAKKASLYGGITPQLRNDSPLTDIVVVHSDVSNGGGNSGETGDPSGSDGGSGGIGDISGSNDGNSNGVIGDISGSNDGNINPDIGGPPNSNGSGDGGGIAGPPGSNGDGSEEPIPPDGEGNPDPERTTFEGILFLIMAMIAGVATVVLDVAGNKHTDNQKNLLICINIFSAISFFSSFFGLLGVLRRIHTGRNSLVKARKISLIIAVTFMLVTMIMVFVFAHVKLAEKEK